MNHFFLAMIASFLSIRSVLAQDQQIGARTKAMGGSYTAFEDDPVSIWLNPAGIATQPLQGTITYNTYTSYELSGTSGGLVGGEPESILVEPAFIPGFLGIVWPIGSEDAPMALGFAYARPRNGTDDLRGSSGRRLCGILRTSYGSSSRFLLLRSGHNKPPRTTRRRRPHHRL